MFCNQSNPVVRTSTQNVFVCVLAIFFVLGVVQSVHAQTWTGNAFTSDWNTPTNWSTNNVPANNATVIIPNVSGGRQFPVITSPVTVGSLTISNNAGFATVTVTNGASLTVTGTLRITPDGRLIANNSSTITHTGGTLTLEFTTNELIQLNASTFSTTVSTATVNSFISAINGSTLQFGGNLTLGSSRQINATGSTVNANGRLLMNSSSQLNAQNVNITNPATSGGNADITLQSSAILNTSVIGLSTNRNLDIESGAQFIVSQSGTISVGNDVELKSSNSLLELNNVDLTVGGAFRTRSSTTLELNGTSLNLSGTVRIEGTANFGAGNSIFSATSDVIVRSGGVINLTSASAEIDFFGTATIENNGTLNVNDGRVTFHNNITTQGNATITVGDGTVQFLGDGTFGNSSTLSINGTGSIEIAGDGTFQQSGNISVGDGSLSIGGTATFQNSGTLNADNGSITLSGDVLLANSGGVINAGTSTILFEGGTFNNSGSFNPGESTFIFGGDGDQVITGSNQNIQFFNLEIEDGSNVTSFQDVTVLNNMTVDPNATYENENNTTLNVVGTITGDPQILGDAPFILAIEIVNLTTINVFFSRDLNAGPAQTASNYKVRNTLGGQFSDPGTAIVSATLSGTNPRLVTIDVGFTIVQDTQYYLWVQNITESESGNNLGVSVPHRKLFVDGSPPVFFSRSNGDWTDNGSWAFQSHTGPVATRTPGQGGDQVVIGNNHTISVTSNVSLAPLASIVVNVTGTLRVSNSGFLNLANRIVLGDGEFLLDSGGRLSIGSPGGIAQSGGTGNIQTASRVFSDGAQFTYNGDLAQVTGTGLPANVLNLTINNPNGVTLTSNTAVTGDITLESGNFIISSDRSLITGNVMYNGGQFEARRFIATPTDGQTPGGWRLLSSPLNVAYNNFFSDLTTQGFTGSSLGFSFTNTTLDTTMSLMPSVLWYNETFAGTDNQRWRTLTDAANTITPGRGYFTYVFGNIATDPRYNQSEITLQVTGQENTGTAGSVNLPVTYTPDGDQGWNLVGNPFLAAIDWDAASGWTRSNMSNTIYVWDETTGQFRFWNGTTGTLNDPLNEDNTSGSGIIMPFQGFWVKAEDTNPQLTVTPQARTIGAATFYRSFRQHEEIELVFEMADLSARTFVMFSEDGRSGIDSKDAYRLQSLATTYLDVYTINRDGDRLAINNLPSRFARTLEIPLNIDGVRDGGPLTGDVAVRLGSGSNIPAHWDVELIDHHTGSRHVLSESRNDGFTFRVHTSGRLSKGLRGAPGATIQPEEIQPVLMRSNPSQARFTLRVTPNEASGEIPTDFSLAQNFPNPFNPTTTIMYAVAEDGPVLLEVFDVTGRRVVTLVDSYQQAGRYDVRFDASQLSSGVYIYRLVTMEGSFSKKMTLIR